MNLNITQKTITNSRPSRASTRMYFHRRYSPTSVVRKRLQTSTAFSAGTLCQNRTTYMVRFFTIETDPFDSHWQHLAALLVFWSF